MLIIPKMRVIHLLFLFVLFSACSAKLKVTTNMDLREDLSSKNPALINGQFNRKSTDNCEDLFRIFFNTGYSADNGKCSFEFKYIDENHISVSMIENGIVLKTSIRYGEFVDGMFEFNLKLFAVPLLIVNVFEASRVRVGILKNGSLTVDKRVRNINYWLLIIFSSRSWATYDMEFARMNEIVVD